MFIGEILCLLTFKFVWYSTARYRISQMTYKGDASSCMVQCWPVRINKEIGLTDGEQDFNPLILWIPAIFDIDMFGLFCLELYQCRYISNASRFCHRFHCCFQVENFRKMNTYAHFFV